MRPHWAKVLIAAMSLAVIFVVSAQADSGIWSKASKPKFPPEALKAFIEGSVTIRAVIALNGSVAKAIVAKSSGDARLDNAAQQNVLKWKMKPTAITTSDLTRGRLLVFDFTQEAMPGAIYADRKAWFGGASATPWIFAPFPAYPENSRRRRQEGTVQLQVQIGADATVSHIEILQSSGYPALDNAAVTAVRYWRTHKRYANTRGRFPITFKLSPH